MLLIITNVNREPRKLYQSDNLANLRGQKPSYEYIIDIRWDSQR